MKIRRMAIPKLILATQDLDLGKSSETKHNKWSETDKLANSGRKKGGTIDGMWHALGGAYLMKHGKWSIISWLASVHQGNQWKIAGFFPNRPAIIPFGESINLFRTDYWCRMIAPVNVQKKHECRKEITTTNPTLRVLESPGSNLTERYWSISKICLTHAHPTIPDLIKAPRDLELRCVAQGDGSLNEKLDIASIALCPGTIMFATKSWHRTTDIWNTCYV